MSENDLETKAQELKDTVQSYVDILNIIAPQISTSNVKMVDMMIKFEELNRQLNKANQKIDNALLQMNSYTRSSSKEYKDIVRG